jgi:hypothetical protein
VAGATTNLARVVAGLGRTGDGGVASRRCGAAWHPLRPPVASGGLVRRASSGVKVAEDLREDEGW